RRSTSDTACATWAGLRRCAGRRSRRLLRGCGNSSAGRAGAGTGGQAEVAGPAPQGQVVSGLDSTGDHQRRAEGELLHQARDQRASSGARATEIACTTETAKNSQPSATTETW